MLITIVLPVHDGKENDSSASYVKGITVGFIDCVLAHHLKKYVIKEVIERT